MRSSRGLRLGSIRGVPLFLTSGWALVFVVLIVIFAPTVARALGVGLAPAAAIAAGVPLLLAVSVLAHELAHGLTAQGLGYEVREYVLSLWGGHTAFEADMARPGASALVAVVGPLTNAVLAAGFWFGAQAAGGPAARLVLGAVAVTNAFVAAFNALPALPMDGGRLLEALVWRLSHDRDLGTLVAARCGQVVAGALVLGALVYGGMTQAWTTLIWGLLIGSMLWQGATAAVRVARARRATRDVDLMAWALPVAVLDAGAPITMLRAIPPGQSVVLVTARDGTPAGWVQPSAVQAVPEDAWQHTPLAAVAVTLPGEAVLTTHVGADAIAQLARAAKAGARFVVLTGPDRAILGAVDVVDASRRLPR